MPSEIGIPRVDLITPAPFKQFPFSDREPKKESCALIFATFQAWDIYVIQVRAQGSPYKASINYEEQSQAAFLCSRYQQRDRTYRELD
jgi:hypothetical protein